MAKTTAYDYHATPSQHGSYQYLSLKELVNSFMVPTNQDDSLLKNINRTIVVKHFKDGIRDHNKQHFNEVNRIEVTVPEKLYIPLPHDYVEYVRCSVSVLNNETGGYDLKPLGINTNANIADGYLQDNNAEILFDNDGRVITADGTNVYNKPLVKYSVDNSCSPQQNQSKYGEYVIDKGRIAFSSDLYDKEIVFEYTSDGLAFDTYGEGQIRVHKDCVRFLNDWVYFLCLNDKGSIDGQTKDRALKRYKTTLHQSNINKSDFDMFYLQGILRVK